jgi:hypothetical protein
VLDATTRLMRSQGALKTVTQCGMLPGNFFSGAVVARLLVTDPAGELFTDERRSNERHSRTGTAPTSVADGFVAAAGRLFVRPVGVPEAQHGGGARRVAMKTVTQSGMLTWQLFLRGGCWPPPGH